jgi:hypothetical protein
MCSTAGVVRHGKGVALGTPAETVTTCTGGAPEWLPWVAAVVLLTFLLAQVLVAVRLFRRAARS